MFLVSNVDYENEQHKASYWEENTYFQLNEGKGAAQ